MGEKQFKKWQKVGTYKDKYLCNTNTIVLKIDMFRIHTLKIIFVHNISQFLEPI